MKILLATQLHFKIRVGYDAKLLRDTIQTFVLIRYKLEPNTSS